MNGITALHVAGGAIALAAGSVAILVRKGRGMHAAAGTGFCLAMFVLGLTASLLAPLKSPPESPVGGIVVCYFVATAWMAARRRSGAPGPIENVACAFAVAIGAAIIGRGFALAFAPPGQFAGPPGPGALFALGGVCLFAGLLDLRWILRRTQSATQRISRHLWRMCFAFFMATGSFFLGQQDVLPAAMRGSPMLFVPAFAPFAAMLFWLLRVRYARTAPRPCRPALPVEE